MDHIVRLEKQDEIARLHAEIEWAQGRRVIVEVPRGARALDQLHEQRLLRRWADDSGVQVALVTSDLSLQELAGTAGIPVFPSVRLARGARWKWGPEGEEIRSRIQEYAPEFGPPRARLLGERLWDSLQQLAITLVLLAVAAAGLAGAAVTLVPSASIEITPAAVPLYSTRQVVLDMTAPGTDVEAGVIPARLLTREISGTGVLATSKLQDAPAVRAKGDVVFTNLGGQESTIPRGTIVETSAGVVVRFTTMTTGTLPAGYGARAQVPVEAVDLGPIGNVKALQINFIEGPVAGYARVVNPNPTTGGAVKPVRIVTRDDKTKLRDQLIAQLQKGAALGLQAESGDYFILLDSVKLQVNNEVYDHLVDDPADQLSLFVQADASGIGVSKKRLGDYADSVLRQELSSGYVILPNSTQFEIDPAITIQDGNYVLKLRAVAHTMPQVNAGQLVDSIQGLAPNVASAELARLVKLDAPPIIKMNPGWWPRLPQVSFRIALSVQSPSRPHTGQ